MEGISLDPRTLYDQVRSVDRGLRGLNDGKTDFQRILDSKNDKTRKEAELKKACSAFESLFIEQMFKAMRKNVQKSDLLKGGFAEDVFEDMLYGEYSQKMAESDRFGLSKMLYDSMSRYI
jgi:Rod binding domain-containing protein